MRPTRWKAKKEGHLRQVHSGAFNGSGGLVESTRQLFLPPLAGIFANGFE